MLTFLLQLAIILFSTKTLGILMRKLGLPQVVGALIAGLLIGPAIWSPMTGGKFIPVSDSEILRILAELGVILLMFSAGLETDLKELKNTGLVATIIASAGVLLPMGLGFAIAIPFFGLGDIHGILTCVFIGTILTATSVGITVETLREMGKLKGKVGTTILSAAIIDDVIGIILLTFIISLKDPSNGKPVYMVLINIILFFALAIGGGIGLKFLFGILIKKYPNRRRVPIFGLVVCLLYAYAAEKFFGIADITGAYLAGIMLSSVKEAPYIERKIDVNSYMIFSPIFFASIGIKTSFDNFNMMVMLFAGLFVLAGIVGKVVGCGATAKLCKFSNRDSLKVGIGMMARGEVALIVTQKGMASGIIAPQYLTAVILLVIVSSLVAPILLKVLYRKDPPAMGGLVEKVMGSSLDTAPMEEVAANSVEVSVNNSTENIQDVEQAVQDIGDSPKTVTI